MSMYDKERMREMIKNPLFRAANPDLCKRFEQEEKEAEAENKIKEYLREHPGASFAELIIKAKVDIKVLESLIADGRVDIKITAADREHLEEIQKEMLANLNKIGGSLHESHVKKQKEHEEATRASGMYSKKDKLGTDQQPRK